LLDNGSRATGRPGWRMRNSSSANSLGLRSTEWPERRTVCGETIQLENLASLGVNLNDDGTLSVDTYALASSLSSNFSSVQSFLQSATSGFANHLANALTGIADPSTGVLGLDQKGITQSLQALGQQISDLQAALAVKQQDSHKPMRRSTPPCRNCRCFRIS